MDTESMTTGDRCGVADREGRVPCRTAKNHCRGERLRQRHSSQVGNSSCRRLWYRSAYQIRSRRGPPAPMLPSIRVTLCYADRGVRQIETPQGRQGLLRRRGLEAAVGSESTRVGPSGWTRRSGPDAVVAVLHGSWLGRGGSGSKRAAIEGAELMDHHRGIRRRPVGARGQHGWERLAEARQLRGARIAMWVHAVSTQALIASAAAGACPGLGAVRRGGCLRGCHRLTPALGTAVQDGSDVVQSVEEVAAAQFGGRHRRFTRPAGRCRQSKRRGHKTQAGW